MLNSRPIALPMIRSDLEGRKMKYAIEAALDVTVFFSQPTELKVPFESDSI